MKKKRLKALFLAAVMTFSMVTSPITAYAESAVQDVDVGLCAHHTAHDDSCGYQAPVEGAACNHIHDAACGYVEGKEEVPCDKECVDLDGDGVIDHDPACAYTPAVEPQPCQHVHDESCGFVEPVEGKPCQFLCSVCDCICSSRCADGAVNPDCPVCAQNPAECSFTTVNFSLSFDKDYAQLGENSASMTITGSIEGKKVTQAVVRISLTPEEAALLTVPQNDAGLVLENNVLTLVLNNDEATGMSRVEQTVSVSASGSGVLDLSAEDVSIQIAPEEYQNSQLVSTGFTGDRITFVEKLPTEDEYGSNMAYQATVEPLIVHYVDSEGKPAARQETAPAFTLYYQVGQNAAQPLQGDSLPFGLTKIPEITATPGEDSWTGNVADTSSLPSAVLALEGGSYVEQPVSWYLAPSYPQDYYPNAGELVEITDQNAGNYPAGLGRGWYYIAGQEPFPDDTVTVKEFVEQFTHNVYWADNGNAEKKRPESIDGSYELQYAFNGSSSYQTLTQERLADLGLSVMPQPEITKQSGIWKFDWNNSLPSKVVYSDSTGSGTSVSRDVSWRVVFKDALDTYAMVEITEENAGDYSSVDDQYGTYYILEATLTFTARLYRGISFQDTGILREAFLEHFYLDAEYTGDQHQYFELSDIRDDGHFTDDENDNNRDIITVSITNLWRYNLDNTRINYSIHEENSSADYKMDNVPGLESGDYFTVVYDNSAVPSFGNETDALYSGGILKLILTGKIDYTATKVWLDDGKTARPQAELELWRYRSGEPYGTAALVRGEGGKPYVFKLDDATPNADGSYTIEFSDLPKYDTEGHRYRYVTREYLSGENASRYEQVFGSIDEDGMVEDYYPEGDQERPLGDTYLYNGGTLSNRLRDATSLTVVKDWKAVSFQSEFDDVMVEMRLQARYKEDGGEWYDTEYTYQMFGFLAENLTASYTGTYPQYDSQGKELEYRWVEESVWQGGKVENGVYTGGHEVESTEEADGSRTFVLEQNNRKVIYKSVSEISPENETRTVITNSIANVVNYDVTKVFTDGWNPDEYEDSYTFSLFRSISGSALTRYATFTIDGDAQNQPPVITKHVQDGASLEIEQTEAWKVHISGLPEFDADGQQYEYMLLEETGSMLHMDSQRDDNGNYFSTVYNGPGEGTIILVRKEWIDESDVQHRLPVVVTAYDKNTHEAIGTATLGEEDIWYAQIDIGKRNAEDVYVLETQVGDSEVDYSNAQLPPVYTGDSDEPTAVWFKTQYHDYEVTYSFDENFGENESQFAGIPCFTVTNRRLGNINLTITKKWLDGEGEKREELQQALEDAGLSLAVKLDFLNPASIGQESVYEISREGYGDAAKGDTITISRGNPTEILDNNGAWTDSIQPLDLSQGTQMLYFWGLPKYDGNGASVRYTVSEVFVDDMGNVQDVTAASASDSYKAVAKAWQEYRASTTVGEYQVGENHVLDTQDFELTNRLAGTTTASWYALWQDEFAYIGGSRPDIYLNIYARTHVSETETKSEIVLRNYRWEYDAEAGSDPEVSERDFWKCNIENLPKYDDLGYEIEYFAVMNATVVSSDFDYLDTAYAPGKSTDSDGVFATASDATGASEENQKKLLDVSADPETGHNYALQSGNTFINTIYDTITYAGEKIWANLPDSYPLVDLPEVTFTLNRSIAGGPTEKAVATMTIRGSDWEKLNVSGHYIFTFGHTGENAPASSIEGVVPPEGESLLPRFDEKGRLYTYTLEEKVNWTGSEAGEQAGDSIFSLQSTGKVLTNSYNKGNAYLSAVKYLTVPKDQEKYPAITMNLTRTYTTNEGTTSAPRNVKTLVWSAADVKAAVDGALDEDGDGMVTVMYTFTFSELPVYAPNGSRYNYTITENKGQLGGYVTWVEKGERTAEELEQGAPITGTSVQVADLLAHEDPDLIDASFLNQPEETPSPVRLTGVKVWNDLNDAFHFRPDVTQGLTIKLERMANSQTGQNNGIGWTTVSNPAIQWSQDPANGNQWTYSIENLDRYAPNGMPWIYRVTETAPEYYVPSGGGVANQNSVDADGNIQMKNLTNSILTSTGFKKTWVNGNGAPINENILGADIELEVSYALQVRAKEGTSTSDWQDAGAYFNATLDSNDQSGMKNRDYTGSIRAALGDAKWKNTYRGNGNSFNNLPRYIVANAKTYELQYRVVETAVRVYRTGETDPLLTQTYTAPLDNGDGNYTYTVVSDPAGTELVSPYYASGTGQANNTQEHKNRIETRDLTVAKVWANDNNEIYHTRPDSENTRYTWETTFVVKRSTDGIKWERIPGEAEITLYGTDSDDDVSKTITGLASYAFDANGNLVPCQYRVWELQSAEATVPGTERELEQDALFHGGYQVSYSSDGLTVTNTLATTEWKAVKDWNDHESTHAAVTLELKYLKEGGDPAKDADYRSLSPAARVTLNGTADANPTRLYYEDGAWTAIWKSVPQTLLHSGVDAAGHTVYKIFENVSGNYIVETTTDGDTTTIVNTPTVSLSVAKHWLGVEPAESVTVTLYRKTEANPTAQEVIRVDLTEAKGWAHTFAPQAKYDPDGNAYTYWVEETKIGDQDANTAATAGGFDITYGGDAQTGFHVYNHALGTIYVIKDWADVAEPTKRPETLELTVQRTTKANPGEGDWETVTGLSYTWAKDGDQWTTNFDQLPEYDIQTGAAYTYRVKETVPAGYEQTIVADVPGTFHFRNTLSEKIDIPVRKVWEDHNDHLGYRPDSITVELYQNGEPTGKTLELVSNLLQSLWNKVTGGSTGWYGVFENLPKYDEKGALILYTVEETPVPEHYEVGYETAEDGTLVITNTAYGNLTVSKQVTGDGADPKDTFHFTVRLGDDSITGEYGDMTFSKGVATFSLHDGESVTAKDLPSGVTYAVEEAEANQNRYTTTSSGEKGSILAGDTVAAKFVNHFTPAPTPTPDPVPPETTGGVPQTGDTSNLSLWIALAAISFLGLVVGIPLYKRRKN